MKEILAGAGFERAVDELKIKAKCTYSESPTKLLARGAYHVWEVEDESFDFLTKLTEEDWKDEWGWWRYAEGTNIDDSPELTTQINSKDITVWINDFKLEEDINEQIEECKEDEVEYDVDRIEASIISEKKYHTLTEYCIREWGASMERNVCAITVGLAKLNGMTLSQLWNKYQG